MTTMLPPMCLSCARFHKDMGSGLRCDAYPDGIPDGIIDSERDHRVPQPGDHGLQYDPEPGAEPQDWWPDERGIQP